ncbi:MAG: DUF327 family protein [Synergistaceae bacterium]|jgi:uncharacterized protein YaaR (DUF327 family)|nr:DUF327 family protein [Synergistaceae bacterium]
MKISDATKAKTGGASSLFGGGKSSSGTAATGAAPTQAVFSDVVDDIESHQLIEELESIGLRLSRFPTQDLLNRYRELVGMALDKVKKTMRLKREFKWRRTERSMFVVIERTEDALQEMDDALMREADRTRMLSLMEEIKGCLISLLF